MTRSHIRPPGPIDTRFRSAAVRVSSLAGMEVRWHWKAALAAVALAGTFAVLGAVSSQPELVFAHQARLLGTLFSVYLGATSVGRELREGTLFSLLSKSVSRNVLCAGKWLGCAGLLLGVVAAQVGLWGLLLGWGGEGFGRVVLQAAVLNFFVAVLNMSIAFAFGAGGHPWLGATGTAILALGYAELAMPLRRFGRLGELGFSLFRLVTPNWDRYSVFDNIRFGRDIPAPVALLVGLDIVAWTALAFFLACVVFSRRDLCRKSD